MINLDLHTIFVYRMRNAWHFYYIQVMQLLFPRENIYLYTLVYILFIVGFDITTDAYYRVGGVSLWTLIIYPSLYWKTCHFSLLYFWWQEYIYMYVHWQIHNHILSLLGCFFGPKWQSPLNEGKCIQCNKSWKYVCSCAKHLVAYIIKNIPFARPRFPTSKLLASTKEKNKIKMLHKWLST